MAAAPGVHRARADAADPMAIPLMNAASIAANAYVVGPSVIARARVNATSYTSATKPEAASD